MGKAERMSWGLLFSLGQPACGTLAHGHDHVDDAVSSDGVLFIILIFFFDRARVVSLMPGTLCTCRPHTFSGERLSEGFF